MKRKSVQKYRAFARNTWGVLGALLLLAAGFYIVCAFLPAAEGSHIRIPRWFVVVPIVFFGLFGFLCVRRSVYWHRMISSEQSKQDDAA